MNPRRPLGYFVILMVTNEQIAELQSAMAHQKAGRLSDAAKAYNRLLQQMPGNFGCIYSLASSFAGRVGASINKATGMPELVTNSLAEYEALALKIARDPALCAALKEKLARNRASYPLFDTARLARHVETAYERMWQTYRDGRPPASFAVESNGRSGGV